MSRCRKILILGVMTVLFFSLVLPGQQKQFKPPINFNLKKGITLKVKPTANYYGACPIKLIFEGAIIPGRPGQVKYYFLRSDGVKTRQKSQLYVKAVRIPVKMTWRINKKYSGWVELHVTLGKKKMTPKRVNFSVRCVTPIKLPAPKFTIKIGKMNVALKHADLSIPYITPPFPWVASGNKKKAIFRIANRGTVDAPACKISITLVAPRKVFDGKNSKTWEYDMAAVPAGKVGSMEMEFLFYTKGWWKIIAKADSQDTVEEGLKENNNTLTHTFKVVSSYY